MNSITIKDNIRKEVLEILREYDSTLTVTVERPKDRSFGDYAVPCFSYAKKLHKSPNDIANDIKDKLDKSVYEVVEVQAGYVNIFLKKEQLTSTIIDKVMTSGADYGNLAVGEGKRIVLDYSSPNIAKPFGVGHLRSTVIGNAIKNICQKLGYQTTAINYLGDWGTQFGKIICAYNMWGYEEMLLTNTIDEIQRLYVKFHELSASDPSYDEQARACFKELENGNEEYLRLWQILREASLKEFMKTYNLLGIKDFDSYEGEASANKKSAHALELIEEKKLLTLDDGAYIIKFDDLIPAIIKKNDGSSIYMTREIAEIIDRKEKYNFDEIVYVVGSEQTLHFEQLKRIIAMLGYDWFNDIHHISFGMFLQGGKKMSTRQGKTVKLHDVLEEAVALADDYIVKKNPTLPNREEVSREIGVGAVIFNDLKNYRVNDVEFNLEDVLNFVGETGPYVQYTYARINTILKKQPIADKITNKMVVNEYVWNIISKISEFEETIIQAKRDYDPSALGKFVLDLCTAFNKFYAGDRIITDNVEETNYKLQISYITATVIKEAMRLLGISVPSQM